MATIPIQAMEVAKTVSGNSPFTMSFPEAATQTFKKGAVVSFNQDGYLTVGSGNEERIVGVAAEDGHSGTTAGQYSCVVWIAYDDTIFRANVDTTTSLLDPGRSYQIEASGNFWIIDKSAGIPSTANRRVIVMRLDPRDAVGDTQGRVEFVFHPQACALQFTS